MPLRVSTNGELMKIPSGSSSQILFPPLHYLSLLYLNGGLIDVGTYDEYDQHIGYC